MQRIRVLLADDHPLLREGIQRVLDADPRLLVVGAAGDGLSALSLAATHHPDVVLLDINMPGLSGIDVARSLTQRQPGIGIVMLTMREDDALVVAAIQAGARAYCHKDADPARLLDVVHRVARGEYLMAEVLIAHPDLRPRSATKAARQPVGGTR